MTFIRRFAKRAATIATALLLAATTLGAAPATALADSSRIVTLGADLTQSQRAQVLDFFGLKEADLQQLQTITVTNADERSHLEGTLPDSVIGNQTLSCSYIEPTSSGGINVETANLTYVTKNTLYNALQTAGIENANLVVTAPYKVSGTGALTGVFMAYEATGKKLDDAKEEAATKEMVDTANLESKYGTGAAEVVGDVKNEVVSGDKNASDEDLRTMIRNAAKEKGIDLSDQDIETILGIVKQVQSLNYDKNAFSNTLEQINGKLDELNKKSDGILGAIQDLFRQIGDWFSQLFAKIGGNEPDATTAQTAEAPETAATTEGTEKHSDAGILGGLNENVFQLDSGKSESGSAERDAAAGAAEGIASEGTAAPAGEASGESVSSNEAAPAEVGSEPVTAAAN